MMAAFVAARIAAEHGLASHSAAGAELVRLGAPAAAMPVAVVGTSARIVLLLVAVASAGRVVREAAAAVMLLRGPLAFRAPADGAVSALAATGVVLARCVIALMAAHGGWIEGRTIRGESNNLYSANINGTSEN